MVKYLSLLYVVNSGSSSFCFKLWNIRNFYVWDQLPCYLFIFRWSCLTLGSSIQRTLLLHLLVIEHSLDIISTLLKSKNCHFQKFPCCEGWDEDISKIWYGIPKASLREEAWRTIRRKAIFASMLAQHIIIHLILQIVCCKMIIICHNCWTTLNLPIITGKTSYCHVVF
jgi:hypothetical protein